MPTTRERPWLRYYGAVPASIDYPRVTLYEAVAATARRSPDAISWDFFGTTATYRELLASIDASFFSFTVRAKRMIKSSGFNVYPAQVERVKAVVVLKDPAQESEPMAQALIDFCRERLIKWSCPREVEFRRELPKTRVGKIDFKVLVAEHHRKAVR